METHDPLLLQVLEQLKSIREDNSRFADDVNRGFHRYEHVLLMFSALPLQGGFSHVILKHSLEAILN